jgi:tetratricopeptide (TPR) repeat protein
MKDLAPAERLLSSNAIEDVETERLMCLAYSSLQDGSRAAPHYRRLLRLVDKEVAAIPGSERYDHLYNVALECETNLPIMSFSRPKPTDYGGAAWGKALSSRLSAEQVRAVINPLATVPSMTNWAVGLVAGATNDMQKARMVFDELLAHAVKKPPKLPLPATAQEVFTTWNEPDASFRCEEFAYLFVAVARCAGLEAYNISVEQDCYGEENPHGCAGVFLPEGLVLVDIPYAWFGVPHERFEVLDDVQTAAEYLAQSGKTENCQMACKLHPRSTLARLNLFTHLANEGKLKEAGKQLKVLVRLDPRGPLTYDARARLALEQNKCDEALRLISDGLKLAPEMDGLYALRGNVYFKKGQWAEARAAYEATLQHAIYEKMAADTRAAIAYIDARERCDWAYVLQKAGDWDGVASNFDLAISFKPDLAEAYYGRGRAQQARGRPDAALADFNKVIELNPSLPQGYVARATLQGRQGAFPLALKDCEAALRLEPKCAEAFYARGCIREATGENSLGLRDLDQALRLNPELAEGYAARALVKQAMGDEASAASDRSKAIKLKPELAGSVQSSKP